MKLLVLMAFTMMSICTSAVGGTIVYASDELGRLISVDYNDEAAIVYQYDKADNIRRYMVLTDSAYLSPFLFYLSDLKHMLPRPLCFRDDSEPDRAVGWPLDS